MPARGAGLTRQEGIVLLDRAAEVGLLAAHGQGYYGIHPALPWFFKGLFERFYPAADLAAVRAFVEAMGELGNYYWDQYEHGNRDVLGALRAEEASLLQARRLARAHGWWRPVITTMQGLRVLYGHSGRRTEWKRLVEEIVPDFVDSKDDGPFPGREKEWGLVTDYRVGLALEDRQWAEAEGLQSALVGWARQHAAAAQAWPAKELEGGERNAIRSLAVSLEALGNIHRELAQAECVPSYQEALDLSERISDQAEAAVCAFNLGHAFKDLPALRDLDQAERWYLKSLELHDERHNRGQCVGQLGSVAWERFREARRAGRPEEELLRHLAEAARRYHEALDLIPTDAVNDLAVIHNQLGMIYRYKGDLDGAVRHYRESIRFEETRGNPYGAALTRFNVALALLNAGRRADALAYAEAALRGYESFGERAGAEIENTRGLIAEIRGG